MLNIRKILIIGLIASMIMAIKFYQPSKITINVIPLSHMSNEQKAAQMLLVYFTTAEYALEHEFGGVLLMAPAFDDVNQLKQDIVTLKAKAAIKPFIAIDQEGGRVNRLKRLADWRDIPSARRLSELSIQGVYESNVPVARYLASLGVNLNLAPVLDPAYNDAQQKTWMGQHDRSFGTTPEEIIPIATAYMKAYQQQGILSIVKHYPGYTSTKNSDNQLLNEAVSEESLERIQRSFQQTTSINSGVMMANIAYTSLSDRPAVIAGKITHEARKLYTVVNKTGLLFTDDLWADGIRTWAERGSSKSNDRDKELLIVTREAIKAGNDVLLITYPEKAVLMKKAMGKWMDEDEEIRRRINESVQRILRIKGQYSNGS